MRPLLALKEEKGEEEEEEEEEEVVAVVVVQIIMNERFCGSSPLMLFLAWRENGSFQEVHAAEPKENLEGEGGGGGGGGEGGAKPMENLESAAGVGEKDKRQIHFFSGIMMVRNPLLALMMNSIHF